MDWDKIDRPRKWSVTDERVSVSYGSCDAPRNDVSPACACIGCCCFICRLRHSFFALFFSKGVPRNIPIAVVDDDRTALSRKLVEMLDAAPTAYVAYVAPSMNEAERLMREGEIMAVVLIPSDFEKELLGGVPTPVEAYITGTNITVNGLLSKDPDHRDDLFRQACSCNCLRCEACQTNKRWPKSCPLDSIGMCCSILTSMTAIIWRRASCP